MKTRTVHFLLFFCILGPARAQTWFGAEMDAGQTVEPSSSSAVGSCTAVLNGQQTEVRIDCTHTVVSPTGAHIHRAPPTLSGPVVFPLGSGQSPIGITWQSPSPEDVADLFAGNLYVNIHSVDYPQAEIRGQFVRQGSPDPQSIILFPHLAIGAGFEVLLLISNAQDVDFNGSLHLPAFGEGTDVHWLVNDMDMTGRDSLEILIPASNTKRFVFRSPPGTGPFAGPLEIHGSSHDPKATLAATFFYEYSIGGRLVDSIGIPQAEPGTRFLLPVELSTESGLNTGVAIQTRSATAGGGETPTDIKVFLVNEKGDIVRQANDPSLGAQFFTGLFPGIEVESEGEFLGSIRIESTSELFVAALRQQIFGDGSFQLTGVPPLVLSDDTTPVTP